MPAPTLLLKGSLVATKYQDQSKLNDYVPIDYILEWISKRWKKEPAGLEDRLLAINSKTGSGKSTALPASIVMKFLAEEGVLVCTQPRRLTAIENPKGIAREPAYAGWFVLGENIGWSTGISKQLPNNGLISMTVDILTMWLRTMSDEEILQKAQFILIDEAHERSKTLDITLYMLKSFLNRNATDTRCPFVFLLSATFDPVKYTNYFGLDEHNVMNVEGKAYPKEENWAPTISTDYVKDAIAKAVELHKSNLDDIPEEADILIFMPGGKEISDVEKTLRKINEQLYQDGQPIFMVLILESDEIKRQSYNYRQVMVPHEDLIVIMDDKKIKPKRRIVISTVVAETGLTIDTLKYVIDCGWYRSIEFNPAIGIGGLITKPAEQSRITQRKGRVGRKFPGKFYALYTEEIYSNLLHSQYPEILTTDISDIFLDLIRIQIELKERDGKRPDFRVEDVDTLDLPPVDSLLYCIEKAYVLGFISPSVNLSEDDKSEDSHAYTLTKLGMAASKINIPMEARRTILAGFAWDISTIDLITMMAFVFNEFPAYKAGVEDIEWLEILYDGAPRHITTTKHDTLLKIRILIADDFIQGLFVYQAVSKVLLHSGLKDMYVGLQSYCNSVKLNFTAIMNFLKTREAYIESFISANIDPFHSRSLYERTPEEFMDTIVRMKYCIYDGFRLNMAVYDENILQYKYRTTPIETPPLLSDNTYNHANEQRYGITRTMLPKKILFSKLNIASDKSNKKVAMYKIKTSFISSMDGFINEDARFL
jgi:hypothetical protein